MWNQKLDLSVFVPNEVMDDHFDGDDDRAKEYFQWAIKDALGMLIADSEKKGVI